MDTDIQAAAQIAAKELEEVDAMFADSFEWGMGYVSDDSYKFGKYTGLQDDGLYIIGNIRLRRLGDQGEYNDLTATNLGLDSRNFLYKFGKQGNFDAYLEYDQLPSFNIDSGVTPYTNPGEADLTLPSGFTMTNLDSYQDLSAETERRGINAGYSFVPRTNWRIGLNVGHETKKGIGIMGGPLGSATTLSPVGETASVLLPTPIDYITDKLEVGADYADKQKQFKVAYKMSMFKNNEDVLTWENPFPDTDKADVGQMALAPDNQFHQISISGGYALTETTKLTGLLSRGLMLQDERFLPYTINPDLDPLPLPIDSLDGKIQLTSARLSLTSRPSRPLRLKASYKYDERNNDTPIEQYNYYVLDSARIRSVINEPLSYKKHKLDLTAQYRFNTYVDTLIGYEYDQAKREFSDVEDNQENKIKGEVKLYPMDTLDFTVKASRMDRNASDYQAENPLQNPLLRKYYLADVNQTIAGVSVGYQPNSLVSISLSGDWVKEDYSDSALGLTEAERPVYTADLSLHPTNDLSLHAFYTREDYDTKQTGFGPYGRETTETNWFANIEDKIDTVGVGIKLMKLGGKVDLGADAVYTKADSETFTFMEGVTSIPYPSLSNELRRINLYALYQHTKDIAVKFSYLHEEFKSTDWALDGTNPLSASDNMILLGNESPNYDNDVVMMTLIHHF